MSFFDEKCISYSQVHGKKGMVMPPYNFSVGNPVALQFRGRGNGKINEAN